MSLTVTNAAARAARFVEQIPPFPGGFEGRGIVTCAGGVKYLTCAWVLINMLRRVGCTLPIEVWYLGDDEGDPNWIKLVEPLGVTCINAFEVEKQHPHPRLEGWESKSFAILHSRFKEVLFLDADNMPLVDPTFLFESPEYKQTGAVFWPDGPRMGPDNPAWQAFGVPHRDEPEVESGQLLIDKDRCWKPLNLADWYNRHSDFYYQYVYGDKDTFRFAWHRLGQPYAVPERGTEMIPFTICQHDFSGRRILQHRCLDKWTLFGNRHVADFRQEELCLAVANELSQVWNPMSWPNRRLTNADRELTEQLVGSRFELEHVGFVRWPIELGPRNSIALGMSPHLCFWWHDQEQLVLAGFDGRPVCKLNRTANGQWHGPSVRRPRESYRLKLV